MRKPLPLAVSQFVSLVRETTGNMVPQARYRFLTEVLDRRARAVGQPDLASYVRRLAVGELADEWHQLIPLITIKESYFYRAPQQFRMLNGVILPRLLRANAEERRLRIWSAACARGEEPATLAMVLQESGALGHWDWRILATDVDDEALGTARRGLYGERAVGQVPPALLEKYFERRGNLYELSPVIRQRIHYRSLNLADVAWDLGEDSFDLIFMRNVLIYFPRPLQRRVATQAAGLLSKEGYLFLGASETLWQIHEGLHPLDLDVCFCYHHPKPGQKPPPRPPRPQPGTDRPAADRRSVDRPSVDRPASGRPSRERSATERPPSRRRRQSAPAADAPATPTPDLGIAAPDTPGDEVTVPSVEEVLAEEDASTLEPCALQERLASAAARLADNQMDDARGILEEVLEADPSEPAAHALEGFLFDLDNRVEEAVASYRSALYLDPALFQARLLLADCLMRLGDEDRARHQYREVLAALDSGRERDLVALEVLPLPTRQRAERRCRQVLRQG